MVCYCCVKGCKHNSNMKKRDPTYMVSFHAFPTNPEQKMKWLRAIGRPNWNPPSHTRICSVHFSIDQISHESCRTRIKDDAYPVNELPLNSNFEASHLKVCRICLAYDLKLYSLQEGLLRCCIESIDGFNENQNVEGLPQFVCFECAGHLIRFYRLLEKSIVAQSTLLNIFAHHGEITETLIKCQDRNKLNLVSTLGYSKPKNIYQYSFNHDNYESCPVTPELKCADNEIDPQENGDTEIIMDHNDLCMDDSIATKEHVEVKDIVLTFNALNENKDNFINFNTNGFEDFKTECVENNYEEIQVKKEKHKEPKSETIIAKKKVRKRRNINGLTPDKVAMLQYYDIVKLSFQEQMDEWQKSVSRSRLVSETTYSCEICAKVFAHINSLRIHTISHDSIRGSAECPVCKVRFKSEVLANSHRSRVHGKKFHCKSCPKVFNNVAVAKKHCLWHAGHEYRCSVCAFSSRHQAALRAHERGAHGACACAACGRACATPRGLRLHCATAHREQEVKGNPAFRCQPCNIDFVSESARRVHVLTSSKHKKKPSLCDTHPVDTSLKTTCSKCGEEFPTLKELIAHARSEHRRPSRKKTTWSLPGDSYPTQCEHCGETVNNRKEHWWHVRKQHPKEKHTYKPVITAICETCGKGFQNSTKLQLHELRHSGPRVACPECPRLFYDKYALARHGSVHAAAPAPRPHACARCPRAFRLPDTLRRHAKVHTSATPYECTMCGKKFKYSTSVNLHVRTVHYKLPHPPRKKRSRTKNYSSDAVNENISE